MLIHWSSTLKLLSSYPNFHKSHLQLTNINVYFEFYFFSSLFLFILFVGSYHDSAPTIYGVI